MHQILFKFPTFLRDYTPNSNPRGFRHQTPGREGKGESKKSGKKGEKGRKDKKGGEGERRTGGRNFASFVLGIDAPEICEPSPPTDDPDFLELTAVIRPT
jgi:hypothetical protein